MLFKHNNIHKLGLCFKYYQTWFFLITWHVPFCHLWGLKVYVTVNEEKIMCIVTLKFLHLKSVSVVHARKLK